jgi:hypothetical protein
VNHYADYQYERNGVRNYLCFLNRWLGGHVEMAERRTKQDYAPDEVFSGCKVIPMLTGLQLFTINSTLMFLLPFM